MVICICILDLLLNSCHVYNLYIFQAFCRIRTTDMDQLWSCGWGRLSFWFQLRIQHFSKRCSWRLKISCLWREELLGWHLDPAAYSHPPLTRSTELHSLPFSFFIHIYIDIYSIFTYLNGISCFRGCCLFLGYKQRSNFCQIVECLYWVIQKAIWTE